MEAIGFNIPGLISQFINFGIFLILMSLILYKPVTRMLDQRAERIREALSEAERAREESARSGEEVQQALAEARDRAQQIIQQATETSRRQAEELLAQARQDAEAVAERSREELRREAAEIIEQGRQEIINLSIMAAERIINQSLDHDAHRGLVEEVLREAEEITNGGGF